MARTKKQVMDSEADRKVRGQQQNPTRDLKSKTPVVENSATHTCASSGSKSMGASPSSFTSMCNNGASMLIAPSRITRTSAARDSGDGGKGRELAPRTRTVCSKGKLLGHLANNSSDTMVSGSSYLASASSALCAGEFSDSSDVARESSLGSQSNFAQDSQDSHPPGSMTSQPNLPFSLVSHVNLPQAFVRVQDICKTSGEDVLKMMKGQVKNDTRKESDSPCTVSSEDGQEAGTRKSSGADMGSGDKTVSSTTSCSKNIFEKFNTEMGRKSPRRSASPRGGQFTSTSVLDNTPSRSGSEEKQQQSIASAVKALRGISEKVSEGRSRKQLRRESGSGKSSRDSSPRTASPMKQSPRRSGEKTSPPDAAVRPVKVKKTNSAPASSESNSSSPVAARRVHSPRRQSLEQAGGVSVSVLTGGNKAGQGPSSYEVVAGKSDSSKEHAKIHILSSTSSHIRDASVVPAEARSPSLPHTSRRLFTGPGHSDHSRVSEVSRDSEQSPAASSSISLRSLSSSQKSKESVGPGLPAHSSHKPEDTESSLLCAMLVGGSEVTKNYEQSREHKAHTGTPNPPQTSSPASSVSQPCDSASFFDDDSLMEVEETPYELPLLSRLPPLPKPNSAVLELTKTEKTKQDRLNKPWPGHTMKTSSLLALISKVRDYLHLSTDDGEDKAATETGENTPPASASQESLCTSQGSETGSIASTQSTPSKTSSYTVLSSTSIGGHTSSARSLGSDACTDRSVSSTTFATCSDKDSGEDSKVQSSSCALPDVHSFHSSPCLAKPSMEKNGDCSESVGQANSVCDEKPGSPDSLGELDTAQITRAANQAVQSGQSSKPMEDAPSSSSQPGNADSSTSCMTNKLLTRQPSEGPSRPGSDYSIALCPTGPRALARGPASSFRSRLASQLSTQSPVKKRWQPKAQQAQPEGPHLWSRSHEVVSPSPLDIFLRPVKSSANPKSAFWSRELDQYLHNPANRIMVPASRESKLATLVLSDSKYKTYDELQQVLRKSSLYDNHESDGDDALGKSDDEEDDHDHEDEKDFELSKKVDPDFDIVDGLVFTSFESDMAMQAHLTVEKVLKWDKEPLAFVNIAKFRAFEESRRVEGDIRRESQGLRGVHMRWRKYQRLYRRELKTIHEENGVPWTYGKVSEKTSDITKIKNWKKKYGEIKKEEGEESHGEENQQKVKRKRKTYVFSTKKKAKRNSLSSGLRKGASEGERAVDTSFDSLKTDPDESYDHDSDQEVDEDGDYGHPIPIDQDDYMEDVQNSIAEMDMKQHGMRFSRTLFNRLNMGPEDRHIIKKLGGWVTRLRMYRHMPNDKVPDSADKEKKKSKQRKEESDFSLPVISLPMARTAVSVLQLNSTPGPRLSRASSGSSEASRLSSGRDTMELMDGSLMDGSPDLQAKPACDKPGCRYGCICHLCQPSGESDEQEQSVNATIQKRTCDKEYCRLGCICDSLEKSSQHTTPTHCGKPECVLRCTCKPASAGDVHLLPKEPETSKTTKDKTSTVKPDSVDLVDSSGDELPTLEKTTARRQRSTDRYSNLPRRQTSYRVAKNLDAVSRKAMMLYETSEIYWEQKSLRRKKSTDPATTPSPPRSAAATSPGASTVTESTGAQTVPASSLELADNVSALPTLGTLTGRNHRDVTKVAASADTADSHIKQEEATENSTAVSVSDDETKESTQAVSSSNYESKRSRMKRKMFDSEADKTAPNTSQASTTSAVATATTQSTPSQPPHPAPAASNQPVVNSLPENIHTTSSMCRWHTSMVCLKANPVGKAKDSKSEEVQEEDEIKLLEFISNCNWDSAKRDILYKVAGCLTRGQYPAPRVMLVGDFRVEILPKASKRSVIPPELRNRLPEMMYSIRVRVTQFKNFHTAQPIMTLKNPTGFNPAAVPANVPGTAQTNSTLPPPTHQGMVFPGSAFGPMYRFSGFRGPVPPTSEAQTPTSMGISGLGRLQISQNKTKPLSDIQSGQAESFRLQAQRLKDGEKAVSDKQKKKADTAKEHVENKPGVAGQSGMEFAMHHPIPDGAARPPADASASAVGLTAPAGLPDSSGKVYSKEKPLQSLETLVNDTTGRPSVKSAQDLAGKTPAPLDLSGKSVPTYVAPTRMGYPQAFPVGKVSATVSGQGPGKAQLIGVSASQLSDIKFIQLPNQGGILQLLPANALGIKTPVAGKSMPNYVAIPVSIAPVSVAGKKPGMHGQVSQAQVSAVPAAIVSPVMGVIAPTGAISSTNPLSSVVSSSTTVAELVGEPPRKKKKRKKKKLLPEGESLSNAAGDSAATAASATALASALQGLTVSPTKSAPDQVSTVDAASREGVAGPPYFSPSKQAHTHSSSAISTPVMTSKQSDGVPLNSKTDQEDREAYHRISGGVSVYPSVPCNSTSKPNSEQYSVSSTQSAKPMGAQVVTPSSAASGPLTTSLHPSASSTASVIATRPQIHPAHLERNEMAAENHYGGSNSSCSDEDIDIMLSEDDEAVTETPAAKCSQCEQVAGVVTSTCSQCEKGLKKDRERERRASHIQMFQHLKRVLYSQDVRSDGTHVSKAKLLSKAVLMVKYQQKLSLSLKKEADTESKRNAQLQRQLRAKINALKEDGISDAAISAVLSTITPPPVTKTLSEKRRLAGFVSSAASFSSEASRFPVRAEKFALTGKGLTSDVKTSSSVPSSVPHSFADHNSDCLSESKAPRGSETQFSSFKSKSGGSEFVIEVERAEEDESFRDDSFEPSPMKTEGGADCVDNKCKQQDDKADLAASTCEQDNKADSDASVSIDTPIVTEVKQEIQEDDASQMKNKTKDGENEVESRSVKNVQEEHSDSPTCDSPVYPTLSDFVSEREKSVERTKADHIPSKVKPSDGQIITSTDSNLENSSQSSSDPQANVDMKKSSNENHVTETGEANCDEPDGMVPVITSVTSLQNSDFDVSESDVIAR